ncbi:class I SAM-dependent methyltransferase [Rhodanobacter sp. B05]|uniref:class I SAM-dependent methyltransferase n=1 Tax=Rhodanobacter sp. B05 TaxID=1945859 RepID=UPI001C2C7975|nr:class I SAM-dependent methyltransferase [Rhodanobacter sp. B05]
MNRNFHLENHSLVLMRPRIVPPFGWVGHIPFAYLVVDLLRPRCLVELGTHSGNSYMAFCQAVRALELSCRCTAVDAWQGDEHALHYGEQVYRSLRSRHDPLYGDFSRLLRASFDGAVGQFEDGSIDLLHIDGLHTYDAVRHDFKSWLPKLSDRAVVLLHDTSERERGFGVDRFFGELSSRYACFDFRHSHGLGVVAVGSQLPAAFSAFMREAGDSPEAMRGFFEALAGTLVDGDDRPTTAVTEPQPVVCQLFYRGRDEAYDESRMISQPVDATDDTVDLQFRLPVGIRPDYLRFDPADFPGIYGLKRVMLQEGADSHVKELPQLPGRLGHVNGEWVDAAGMHTLRLVSFDGDPNVEFEIGSALAEVVGDDGLQITIRVDYELVVSDPALHRLLEQQAAVSMRRYARARVDVQNLSQAFSQQRGEMQGLAQAFSQQRGEMQSLAQAFSQQRGEVQNLSQAVSQQRDEVQSLTHAFSQQREEVTLALQQLQQGINLLARRGFWPRLRRFIKRGQ